MHSIFLCSLYAFVCKIFIEVNSNYSWHINAVEKEIRVFSQTDSGGTACHPHVDVSLRRTLNPKLFPMVRSVPCMVRHARPSLCELETNCKALKIKSAI